MFDSAIASESPDWSSPQAWLAVRLAIEFVLDVSKISRGEGDLLDPLIMTAALEANHAALRSDPALGRTYADVSSTLPDRLRRPVSVNALAKSLRLPSESVRRRVNAWVAAGVCVRTPTGFYVSETFVTSPGYIRVHSARVDRLAAFERDLVRAGLLEADAGTRPLSEVSRAVDRVLADYMLRICEELIKLADGPVDGFVLLGLSAENAAVFSGARAAPDIAALSAFMEPCSAAALAARLEMPETTIRRRLTALEERGLARRDARGWRVAAPAPLQPQARKAAAECLTNLRRLFIRVREVARA